MWQTTLLALQLPYAYWDYKDNPWEAANAVSELLLFLTILFIYL